MKTLLSLIFVLCLYSVSLNAQTYVDATASGTNNGSSWANAYTNLQSAINATAVNGSIWVAEGTYKPTVEFDADDSGGSDVREKTFYINKNLKIYGGFAGSEFSLGQRDWVANPTILSGDIGTPNNSFDNAYHVVFIDGTTNSITNSTVLEGFHITRGYADKQGGVNLVPFNSFGGAIFHNGRGNGNECSPYILNCKIYDNYGSHFGAVYNDGAEGTCNPEIINCSFYDNEAGQLGGAIVNDGRNSGECEPKITNCTFYNNTTYSSTKTAIHNLGQNGTSDPSFYNCIFWNNGDEITNEGGATTSLYYCIYDDGNPDGNLNLPPEFYYPFSIDLNPLFENVGNKNFQIPYTSPAFNSGYNYSLFGAGGITMTDLAGNPRNSSGTIDRGAYEYQCVTGNVFVNINATGNNDGKTWTDAFTNLQDALDLATACGTTEIWVAAGTYKPTKEFNADNSAGSDARDKTFYISQDFQIYGGFVGSETDLSERDWETNVTILSGDIGTPIDSTDNSYHVIYMNGRTSSNITNACILDGFTIEEGNGDVAVFPNDNGGGIYMDGGGNNNECSPTISNCIFSNNTVTSIGGAINIRGDSGGVGNPIITNCSFVNNRALARGGAIYNYGYLGTCNPTITHCSFSNNSASFNGGAIYNDGSNNGVCSPTITNCVLLNNQADFHGAGIYNISESGGTCSPNITNCSFSGNSTNSGGAALFNYTTANVAIENCIFWGNISQNGVNEIGNFSSTGTTLNYSILADGTIDGSVTLPTGVTGSNNSDADPVFVSATDLRLQTSSPAKNIGNNAATGLTNITTDLDGNIRIVEGIVDMGAYESRCTASGNIIYVDADASNGDGLTWNTAFSNLQDGIDLACACSATEVWVADGTYLPTKRFDTGGDGLRNVREETFYINKNIQIYGGFVGGETALAERDTENNVAILSGNIGSVFTDNDNAYHVVFIDGTSAAGIIDNTTVLDGFRIYYGNANASGVTSNDEGGGIYLNGEGTGKECSPSISNCVISVNYASRGGGIYSNGKNGGISNPELTACTISSNNFSGFSGAGMYNDGNLGTASPILTNCIFSGNSTSSAGGAIYNNGDSGISSPKITNCIFSSNSCFNNYGTGGAIYNNGNNGGTCSPQITNCTFSGNSADYDGGAIGNYSATNVVIENCIFWNNNSPGDNGGNGEDEIADSDIANNTTLNYSLLDDGTIDGTVTLPPNVTGANNIDADPLFVATNDLRLQNNSPAINTGNNAATGLTGITTDLDENPRIVADVDMGAYESTCPEGQVYVNINASVGGDGSSWVAAFQGLQDGIDAACGCLNKEVWVAQGTYKPTVEFDADDSGGNDVREKTFYINKDVQIYGGFASGETALSDRDWKSNVTTLSGDIGTTDDNSDNTYHVVYMDGTTAAGTITNAAILDGFQIINGNANGSANASNNRRGGAIYNDGKGTGSESSPSILNCSFYDNSTNLEGGAIYNNGATNGISSPILTNCSFFNNSTTARGGAIYNYGIYGTCSPIITNCSFYNNSASENGGAIRNWYTTNAIIENCIFWKNTSNVENEIADNQTDPQKQTTLTYSIIDDGTIDGTVTLPPNVTGANNIDADPLFVDAANGNLRLENASPAINVGNNNASGLTGITTDLDGNPRIASPNLNLMFVDMGAYEVQTIAGPDTDMDGVVDSFDNCPDHANPALDFDGVDDHVSISHSSSLDFNNTITIEAWINADTWESNVFQGTIVGMDDFANNDSKGFVLRCGNNGQLSFVVATGGATGWPEVVSDAGAMSLNTWHHVAGVLSSNTIRIYVDGEEVGSATLPTGATFNPSSGDLFIGASPGFGNRLFDGEIDDVRIWNSARTAQQLRGNLLNELSESEAGLVSYYKFNEGTPNTDNTAITDIITDHANNAGQNPGTLNGFSKSGTVSNWVNGAPIVASDADNDQVGDNCDCGISGIAGSTNDCVNGEYSVEFNVNNTFNTGATYSITGDVNIPNLAYNQTHTFPNLTGTLHYTVTDVSGNCAVQLTFNAPVGCGSFYDCTEDDLVINNYNIPSGASHAVNTITSHGSIFSPKVVVFRAGVDIKLLPGFEANAGSDFTAEIVACNTSSLVAEENDELEKDLSKKEITNDDLEEASEETTEAIKKETLTPSLSLYPNPTNRLANIAFTISESSNNTLAIYNNTGTMIKLLADNRWMEQGEYIEEFDVQRLPAGIYVVVLHTVNKTITQKLIVIE